MDILLHMSSLGECVCMYVCMYFWTKMREGMCNLKYLLTNEFEIRVSKIPFILDRDKRMMI